MYNLKKAADYFKAIQEQKEYTQHDLATAAGVAQSSINKIINEQRVRLDTIERAADGLGIARDGNFYRQIGLITPSQPQPVKIQDNHGAPTEEELDIILLDSFRRLSIDNKIKALQFIDKLDQ